ncbi:hypothetical protein CL684_02875 [Candidatus Campbellbacteria bacterium]|nr:hypothetical protein [Candidatus Campbellbacteria bacterium]
MKSNVVHVFIDASNIWNAQQAKGMLFDYKKLISFLKREHAADTIKAYYYTAYPKDGTRDYDVSSKHSFYTYLKKGLNFVVRKKPLKQIKILTDEGIGIKEKGDMDVELTLDVMHTKDQFDTALLFTGDSDYLALVNYLKNGGKKVFIYSSENNISSELRTGGHGYRDVLKIQEDIWGKKLNFRNQKNK